MNYFLPKVFSSWMLLCCTRQVWTVYLSPEPSWETLGIGENPIQQPKPFSFLSAEKPALIDLHLALLKGPFLRYETAIFM